MIVVASARRNDDLPHSASPKSRKCGSAAKSISTWLQVGLGDADRQPQPGRCGRRSSSAYGTDGGQHPDPRGDRARPGVGDRLDQVGGVARCVLSSGSTVSKCRLLFLSVGCSTMPRPGCLRHVRRRPPVAPSSRSGRPAAAPAGSRTGRGSPAGNPSSASVAATTWMPYDRPRVARSVMTGSSSSYSLRSVAQPSTTRKTSPNGSPSVACRPAGRVGAAPPVRRHRVDAQAGEPALPLGQQGRRSRRRYAGPPTGSSRPETPPTCGRSRSAASEPPPKSRQ